MYWVLSKLIVILQYPRNGKFIKLVYAIIRFGIFAFEIFNLKIPQSQQFLQSKLLALTNRFSSRHVMINLYAEGTFYKYQWMKFIFKCFSTDFICILTLETITNDSS